MGASRRFKPGRQAQRASQKAKIKSLVAQNGYLTGLNLSLAAQLEAEKMERPPDLDEWVDSILPDMDEDERAAWAEMSEEERAAFTEELGRRINVTQAALDQTQ